VTTANTILIVDDEPVGRDTLEALLMGQDYELVFATDGEEALAQASTATPDVVLLDVMMPGMDGFEVCRRLRANPRLAEVPVIMVTALDDRDSRLQGIEAGADDFVSKPFDRAELRARVRTVTRLNRYRRLHAERAKFEWVVESAEDGFVLVDEHERVTYANPRARVLLGIATQDQSPVGQVFAELACRHYRAQPRQAWYAGATPPALTPPYYLVQSESQTASAVWLLVDALTLPLGQEVVHLYRLKDVTAQMVLRRQTWTFHSMVSHKLRTPLTGMLASFELLSEDTSELSMSEVLGLAEMASKNVRRLSEEIEDILRYLDTPTLAQVGLGFGFGCADLPALAAQIAAGVNLSSVSVNMAEELKGTRLTLSQRALETMLWELLDNAGKFHPTRAPTVQITVTPIAGDQVCLQVMDDGIHLAPQQLERVWLPYYQDEKYFTGQTPGMGLGLTMVAMMVLGLGGACRMLNRQDRPGVIVEIILPVARRSLT